MFFSSYCHYTSICRMATAEAKKWPQGFPSASSKPLNQWKQFCEGDETQFQDSFSSLSPFLSSCFPPSGALSLSLCWLDVVPFLLEKRSLRAETAHLNICRGWAGNDEWGRPNGASRGEGPKLLRSLPHKKSAQQSQIFQFVKREARSRIFCVKFSNFKMLATNSHF